MKFLLISFKTRNSIFSLMNKLKNFGISSMIINTPKTLSDSCSLSLKVNIEYKNFVINIISQNPYGDLIGVFSVENSGFNERFKRLY